VPGLVAAVADRVAPAAGLDPAAGAQQPGLEAAQDRREVRDPAGRGWARDRAVQHRAGADLMPRWILLRRSDPNRRDPARNWGRK